MYVYVISSSGQSSSDFIFKVFSTFFNSLKSIVVLYNVHITLMSSRQLLNAFESAKNRRVQIKFKIS